MILMPNTVGGPSYAVVEEDTRAPVGWITGQPANVIHGNELDVSSQVIQDLSRSVHSPVMFVCARVRVLAGGGNER